MLVTRFGMRSFRLNPATGRAMLNGRPYFMRGSNVTLYRFFEDAERGDKPWRDEWVRRLHKAFRDMHWNSLRYCIGFPPEAWYRIADEEGFLIQDEFPIWNSRDKPGLYDVGELVREYSEWMQERWNHPCVVIWDACNETVCRKRPRPWARCARAGLLQPALGRWLSAAGPTGRRARAAPLSLRQPEVSLGADRAATRARPVGRPGKNAVILNEYGWLWLNRDGTPTTLTKDLYRNLLGPHSSTAERRHLYARYLAAETEFWRAHRSCAAVMHFCGLGYSRSGENRVPKGRPATTGPTWKSSSGSRSFMRTFATPSLRWA